MNYFAVAIAGFFGAVLRKILSDLQVYGEIPVFPVNTLIINISGCFILSFFMTLTANRFDFPHNLRLAVGTGFLGAYTTFSAFSYETVHLFINNNLLSGVAYIVLTSAGCLISAWVGALAGSRVSGKYEKELEKEEVQ